MFVNKILKAVTFRINSCQLLGSCQLCFTMCLCAPFLGKSLIKYLIVNSYWPIIIFVKVSSYMFERVLNKNLDCVNTWNHPFRTSANFSENKELASLTPWYAHVGEHISG